VADDLLAALKASFDAVPKRPCGYCGHVLGLHGRNHGCISGFGDGVKGQPCTCPGYVTPTSDQGADDE